MWLGSESSGQFGVCRPAYCSSSLAVVNTGPPPILLFFGAATLMEWSGGGTSDELTLLRSAGD